MEKNEYDRYRLLKWIHGKKSITRSYLTIHGLNRFPRHNMKTLYAEVDALLKLGFLHQYFAHIPGRRGPTPKVYEVTEQGAAWLKDCDKKTKKLLKKINA